MIILNKLLFEPLLLHMDTHLASWKTQMLSFVGHITLAKSILMALPNHIMQTMYLSRSVYDEYDKKIRIFFGVIKEGIRRFIW